MDKLLIIALLLSLTIAQSSSTTKCICTQLLSQSDCAKNSQWGCAWDSLKCSVATVTPTTTVTYIAYCDSFSSTDCPKTLGCLWNGTKCTHFTGCTAFVKTTDPECQATSTKCITDGTHCVEVATCEEFTKQLPCVINASGKDCYWNVTDNKCVTATTCDQFRATTTDAICRQKLSSCTAKTGGGCQESGVNCVDQPSELQCFWDKAKVQPCFWNTVTSSCVDRTCALAPSSFTTNDQCSKHLPSCTAKQGGGCVTRATCSGALIKEGCITDSTGAACYWTGTACVNKDCSAASTSLTSNSACDGFIKGCITKSGGGCKANTTSCSGADIEQACVATTTGQLCVWSGAPASCKDKTCLNSPTTNNSHEKCTSYLPTCTVASSGSGCTDRTCLNAASSYKTNSDCNTYKSGCITTGTGCITNTTCDAIMFQDACVKNSLGVDCSWDGSTCKDKTCANAPAASRTSHSACNTYLNTCTVNSTNDGCIDFVCENIFAQGDCVKDKTGQVCVYQAQCYKKQCKTAPQTTASYTACQSYLNSCTLDNSGFGCMTIPLSCSLILTSDGCQQKAGGGLCTWTSGKCTDRTCSIAPNTITSTADCGSFLTGCVVNNTNNGCIDPTTVKCGARAAGNCESNNGFKCLSDSANVCVTKTCLTANSGTVTTVGGTITSGFSNISCNTYLAGCVLNNTGNGCMEKSTKCQDYGSSNCNGVTKVDGTQCYYNGSSCVDRICANITLTTDSDCSGQLSSCTVANSGTACVTKSAVCTGYTKQNQCFTTLTGGICIWTGSACRSTICSDAASSANFNTHDECFAYSSTCTVIERVSNSGCMDMRTNCSDYIESASCVKNSAGNACTWNYDSCILTSALNCSTKRLATYTAASCEGYLRTCINTADSTACRTKVCSDFTNKEGLSTGTTAFVIPPDCTAIDPTCTLKNSTPKVCMVMPDICGGSLVEECTASKLGQCVWNAAATTCLQPSGFSCTVKRGTNMTFATCQTFDSRCSLNIPGTICYPISPTCPDFTPAGQEFCRKSTAGLCKWTGSACAAADPFVCGEIIASGGALLNYVACQDYSNTCSVTSTGSACVTAAACSTFSAAETSCYRGTDGMCFYSSTGPTCTAITSSNCATVIQADLTYNLCQGYHTGCSVNLAFTACVNLSACSAYGAADCYKGSNGMCFYSGSTCNVIATGANCPLITGSGFTDESCEAYHADCRTNSAGTACIQIQAACSQYIASTACIVNSTAVKCFWASSSCIQVTTPSTDCVKVTGSSLTHAGCQTYNTGCGVNAAATACEAKSCANASNASLGGYTDALCSGYLASCTANKVTSPTACVAKLATCSLSLTTDTCVASIEGACVWVTGTAGGSCQKKTCYTAATSLNSHAGCFGYMSTCTVAKVGGCTALAQCSQYYSEDQCKVNSTGGKCFWNGRVSLTCVDRLCTAVESSYNSHALCSGITGITCTVNNAGNGCMNVGACSSYKTDANCKVSSTGSCVWLADTSACVDKTCLTAEISYTTDDNCSAYITYSKSADRCTVAVFTAADGTKTAQGCQLVSACSLYKMAAQCVVNATGGLCAWNDSTGCADKSCLTAPASDLYNTDALCKAYLEDGSCTVATSGQGCIIRPDICEGMTQGQCITNKSGVLCYWNTSSGSCVTKSCSTAPSDVNTADGCASYFPGCTMDEKVKCKNQICEDFVFTTDADCQKAKTGCTTNGVNCVTRTQCIGAIVQGACVTQADGKQCEWMTSTCVLKTCATAPITKVTEADCNQYLEGCTTKSGGGCAIKTTCAAANVQAACTTAVDKTVCVWDNGTCRIQACKDFSGTSHAECQTKGVKGTCTMGISGKCAAMQTCSNTTIREACIQDVTGQPCLWISGACYPYTSCKSQTWTSDSTCKAISTQCTTNGTNCVAITSCSETNITGGCKTGYDGNCIQTAPALNASPAVCKVFTACTDAFYLTHDECQNASSQCTTNGVSSCAPLDACSTYTEKACKINAKGAVLDSTTGYKTSTGICTWDTTLLACRDQNCADFTGIGTHYGCLAKLSGCTSDGTNCLAQAKCGTYTTQTICENAYGTDGPQGECFWDATLATPACRIMACSDIKTGQTATATCQASLTQCVSDGTNCIAKAGCSTYSTKTGCNSGGTDGPCVFTASTVANATAGTGTCKLMTVCADASSDQSACQSVKYKCSWTASSTTGNTTKASVCATHSCATYQSVFGSCGNFLNWGQTLQQICQTVNGTCSAVDPSTLTADTCFSGTAYAYTWSTSTQKCGVCTASTVINNTNNNQTTTNGTTTTSGYIMGLVSLLGYLIF